jgi:Holliday junction resolvasome RuvABC endonuclease subunit
VGQQTRVSGAHPAFGPLLGSTHTRGEEVRILGLDLSLRSTGYVLLDEDHVAWFGTVGSDGDEGRLEMFDWWIREQLRDKYFNQVGIEGYSFASQFQGPALGELGGVIKLAIHQAGVPITIIAPATWKKQLLGKGNLPKDMVRIEAYKRYHVDFASQDTLEAWAVAMCLRRQLLGLDKPEPKVRKRKPAGELLEAMS